MKEEEKVQSTWMDQVEREIERLLEDLYKLYERSVMLGYSANELRSVVRQIEGHLDDVEDAIQSAQALLQRLR
jgi:Holliday junction resolvasome RuvABC DNA-binding subunit